MSILHSPTDRVKLTQKCFQQRVRDCRVVPEFKEHSFIGEVCQPRPMTKCFIYRKKVCVPESKTEYKLITWTNEKLMVNFPSFRQMFAKSFFPHGAFSGERRPDRAALHECPDAELHHGPV